MAVQTNYEQQTNLLLGTINGTEPHTIDSIAIAGADPILAAQPVTILGELGIINSEIFGILCNQAQPELSYPPKPASPLAEFKPKQVAPVLREGTITVLYSGADASTLKPDDPVYIDSSNLFVSDPSGNTLVENMVFSSITSLDEDGSPLVNVRIWMV